MISLQTKCLVLIIVGITSSLTYYVVSWKKLGFLSEAHAASVAFIAVNANSVVTGIYLIIYSIYCLINNVSCISADYFVFGSIFGTALVYINIQKIASKFKDLEIEDIECEPNVNG